jgi:hypothetical protein
VSGHLPVETGIPKHLVARAEREAMARARRWATVDPYYHSEPITRREEALMMLALRALTCPTETDIAQLMGRHSRKSRWARLGSWLWR